MSPSVRLAAERETRETSTGVSLVGWPAYPVLNTLPRFGEVGVNRRCPEPFVEQINVVLQIVADVDDDFFVRLFAGDEIQAFQSTEQPANLTNGGVAQRNLTE